MSFKSDTEANFTFKEVSEIFDTVKKKKLEYIKKFIKDDYKKKNIRDKLSDKEVNETLDRFINNKLRDAETKYSAYANREGIIYYYGGSKSLIDDLNKIFLDYPYLIYFYTSYFMVFYYEALGDTIGYNNGKWEFNYGNLNVGPEYI